MHPVDSIIVVVYFIAVVVVASLFSKSQQSLKDFLMGGRNIPWWAAALAGVATVTSAISYIGAVGLGFSTNFGFLQYRLAVPMAIAVICLIIMPFFFQLRLYSIYEYLEKRFSPMLRLLGSGLFLLFKCAFLAVGIYAPALVMSVLMGIDPLWIVLVTGVVTTGYTLLGGMKAVIWTDVPQLLIMMGGIFIVIFVAASRIDGGFGQVFALAGAHGKFDYVNWSADPTDTYTVWSGIIGGTFLIISQFGADQAEMQRFLSVNSLRRANWAFVTSLLVASLIGFLIFFEGAVLFAFYTQEGNTDIPTNEVFIRFVINELPIGVKGLMVSALFAASMSTISSVLNSMSTVFMADFHRRFSRGEGSVRVARGMTMLFGLVATALACLGGLLGNLLEASTTIINFFGGALVGVFLLGMLSKRAESGGAITGLVAGFVAVLATWLATSVSFMWYSAIGGITTLVVGELYSRLSGRRPRAEQLKLVLKVPRLVRRGR
ncbi:transporter, SSS family [Parapedobacter composti]|uniref:Transporter, SSS family n=1 Tax=Parapedobacter composti TaxID=623281 RepID=A0A1I1HBU3_9SPHI|nr:sodium/solute symporter [Parapedobacter composti]SFC19458.1 transporter, SSS family [Parapedobacter composti]